MDTQIEVVYCFCDDVLKGLHHDEDRQRRMSDAEVMTTSIVAALYFGGNLERARVFLQEHGYIPKMLTKSRFNRRMHTISDLFLVIFDLLGEVWKQLNSESVYVIDSFPTSACDNYRIRSSKRYQGETWRGFQASKKRYFYGLKIHLIITAQGQPVEFSLTPGSWNDTKALKLYNFDLPKGSLVAGDKAYNNYPYEDMLKIEGIDLLPW